MQDILVIEGLPVISGRGSGGLHMVAVRFFVFRISFAFLKPLEA